MILEILKGKGIKETSIKLYLSNLKRLNNNVEPKTLTFLKNTKKILEQIKDKSENTGRRRCTESLESCLQQRKKRLTILS